MSDSKKMLGLLENKEFQELIMDKFIKEGIVTTALSNNLRSDHVLDELVARQILNDYIFGIINSSTD